MDTFRTTALVPVFGLIFILVVFVSALNAMYRRGVRRYERAFVNMYARHFEQRAMIARALHTSLARTIQSGKSAVDQARAKPPDGPEAAVVLNRVSELLERAARESYRALRSLEPSVTRPLHKG
jgi:signal transduction histidine kinase